MSRLRRLDGERTNMIVSHEPVDAVKEASADLGLAGCRECHRHLQAHDRHRWRGEPES